MTVESRDFRGQVLLLRHIAGEYRELRRLEGTEQQRDELFELERQLGSAIDYLFKASCLPRSILAAFTDKNPTGLNLFWEHQIVSFVIGYSEPTYHQEPVEYFDNSCWGGEHYAVLAPGAISQVWPEVFQSIFLGKINPSDDRKLFSAKVMWEQQFKIIGYHAAACDLLASWIEEQDKNVSKLAGDSGLPTLSNMPSGTREHSDNVLPELKEPLTKNDRLILLAMLELDAGKHHPHSAAVVVKTALYRGDQKRAFVNLKLNNLVDSKEGRGNGYWLTEDGILWAEWLATNGATV